MKLYKTKKWSPFEVSFLKLSCSCFGIILGAYCSDFFLQYIWIFIIVGILATFRVWYFYYFTKDD